MSEATDGPHAFYAIYKPTIRERFWRASGFRHANAERPDSDEEGWAPGWLAVNTFAHLGWLDRLRLLISGNVEIECFVKTDVSIGKSRAVSSVGILPPGKRGSYD